MGFDKILPEFDTGYFSMLLIGLLVGSVFTFLALNLGVESKDQAAKNLESVLEAQSGQELEVVNVESENGLYKVDLKNQEDQLTTYHMTKDGESFTQGFANIKDIRTVITAQNNFRSCLSNNNIVMYGNLSQRPTQAQIQLVGGRSVIAPIYKDVSNNQTLVEAANRGVSQVPSLYKNGSTLSGVNNMDSVENFTGCSYEIN